jgi:hypothetical protein
MHAISRALARRASVLLACTAFAVLAIDTAPAGAASAISGCFRYQTTAITGLPTSVQYRTTSGDWAVLRNSLGHTDASGCITYNITGSVRTYSALRIYAAGVVPAWRAMVDGATPYYASAGGSTYRLGTSSLRMRYLPASVATAPTSGTSSWLDEMTNGAACTNDPSPAMQVACYMDRNGMHGNVVVLDYDHDGIEDRYDNYPRDPYRR